MIACPSEVLDAKTMSSTPTGTSDNVKSERERMSKDSGTKTPKRFKDAPKRGYDSMEANALHHEVKRRVLQHVPPGQHLSPKGGLKRTALGPGPSYHSCSMVPTQKKAAQSSFASESLSPLPFRGSARNRSPHPYHPHAASLYNYPPMTFTQAPFLQPCTSLTLDNGFLDGPPMSEPRSNNRSFLLAQPMIASPAPGKFFLNGSGGTFHRQISQRTPIANRVFYPTMFSPSSNFSDFGKSTPRKAVTSTAKSTFAEETMSPVFAFAAQVCDPLLVSAKQQIAVNASSTSRDDEVGGPWRDETLTSAQKMSTDLIKRDSIQRSAPRGKLFSSNAISVQSRAVLQSAQRVTPRGKIFPAITPRVLHVATKTLPPDSDGEDQESYEAEIYCTCPKSKCLKLYCVCFQRDSLCDKKFCKCKSCKNTAKECGPTGVRTIAMERIKMKKPKAFEKRVKQTANGCRCKRNRCLKKYCVCFSEGNSCHEKCTCVACHNQPQSDPDLHAVTPA